MLGTEMRASYETEASIRLNPEEHSSHQFSIIMRSLRLSSTWGWSSHLPSGETAISPSGAQ